VRETNHRNRDVLNRKFAVFGLLLGTGAALTGLGCAKTSNYLVPKPPDVEVKIERVVGALGGETVSFSPTVDILFVVDDSGSMQGHQVRMAQNFPAFTSNIFKSQILDANIGVTTASMSGRDSSSVYGWGGRLHGATKFITRNTPDFERVLNANLKPGTGGDATERFFTPVMRALSEPLLSTVNQGFYRGPKTSLAIVWVSDADDQSDDEVSAKEFVDFLVSDLKAGDASKVLTYAVYIPSAQKDCDRSGEPDPDRIEEFFQIMTLKGQTPKAFSLCDPDFGQKLASIADDVVGKVSRVMRLERPPVVDSILVQYGSQVIPNDPKKGWQYEPTRNAIIFGRDIEILPEPPGTTIKVDFDVAEFQELTN